MSRLVPPTTLSGYIRTVYVDFFMQTTLIFRYRVVYEALSYDRADTARFYYFDDLQEYSSMVSYYTIAHHQ